MTNDFQQELLAKIKEGLKPSDLKAENTPTKKTDGIEFCPAKKISPLNFTTSPPTNNNPLLTTTQLLIITGSLIVMVYLLKK
jgi:hypothetical protein